MFASSQVDEGRCHGRDQSITASLRGEPEEEIELLHLDRKKPGKDHCKWSEASALPRAEKTMGCVLEPSPTLLLFAGPQFANARMQVTIVPGNPRRM